jgi:hypothetical protein
MWATVTTAWLDKRRIRADVVRSGGRVEWIRLWSGGERIRSWRDSFNGLGPVRYRVRRVDADGQTRTSDVHVGMFSGVRWLGPDE